MSDFPTHKGFKFFENYGVESLRDMVFWKVHEGVTAQGEGFVIHDNHDDDEDRVFC